MKKHFLFVCASGTRAGKIQEILENDEKIEVRCAGISPLFGTPLTIDSIRWAGKILVLNEKKEFHKTQLLQKFPEAEDKEIIDLNMPKIGISDPDFENIVRGKIIKYT